ncbi:hypothetical protein IEE_05528 [Bacillus cereus BAG5X1-1]|uniref:Lipoprotein n=1 Tax=Bacillus cereus BAG5X1-1 TaxID=1053189 RepID=J7ZG99_BACCE|nr:DUF5512 family protein [Bacillus cereus]EJQ35451.1 hypothetical protein IEE_05528 [Bacillus cereus BAG5X1-1]
MFKNMKLLSVLFICMTVLLAGCGGNSLPYKKGETYKENDSATFIEVKSDDEWKMHTSKDRPNEYALYKVDETEFKGEKSTVVSLSLKQQFGKSDPLYLKHGAEKYLVVPTENGFAIKRVDLSENNYWEKFKADFKAAKDKEAFLKKVAEKNTRKFEKTN